MIAQSIDKGVGNFMFGILAECVEFNNVTTFKRPH